jgi:uncharacterized protein (DUF362 family)/Pyruvate/2-oxoacid:ferredoxin oxidoreductase delta subunit
MSKVALLPVADYGEAGVRDAVQAGMALLGLEQDFFAGKKVLLKPNLLTSFSVERGVCSHPTVVRAAALAAQETGGRVTLGDSPGFEKVERVARAAGMVEAVKDLDIPLVSFDNDKTDVKFPSGKVCKAFPLGTPVAETEVLVNLARLKTHSYTGYSGAVKNLYGCLSGRSKVSFHMRYNELQAFSRMLADLAGLLRPALSVVDGIVSMEGPGPRRGTPRQNGFFIMSRDPVAADAVACTLVGIDPGDILHLRFAQEAGYGTADIPSLEIVGASLDRLRVKGFKKAPTHQADRRWPPGFLVRMFRDYFLSYPRVEKGKCRACGVCAENCPAAVIRVDKEAVIDYSRCIRCYCCQELCPYEAVELRFFLRRPGSV